MSENNLWKNGQEEQPKFGQLVTLWVETYGYLTGTYQAVLEVYNFTTKKTIIISLVDRQWYWVGIPELKWEDEE